MKKHVIPIVMAFMAMMSSCSSSENELTILPEKTTYVNFSLKFPEGSLTHLTRVGETDYNPDGTVGDASFFSRIDLYLLSAGGVLQEKYRFESEDLVAQLDPNTGQVIVSPAAPFKTTAGDKVALVVLNDPRDALESAPADNYRLDTPSPYQMTHIGAYIDFENHRGFLGIYSGKSAVTTIVDGVTLDQVKTTDANRIKLEISRLVSRTIVTKAPDITTTLAGTFSNITYSIAQGSKSIYLLPQTDGTEYKTWGYDYVPSGDYMTNAAQWYDYADLLNLNDPVLDKPDDRSYLRLEGKLLLENTHADYRMGNTAYVLVRAKFTPNATKDGGALPADGTFYVGDTDGQIYSSIQAATSSQGGVVNQDVATYPQGKVLYYIWLNPDDILKPLKSPVIRNNIYHVNIKSFKKLGVNWNPLDPNVDNPDPKPSGPEPENPMAPDKPLSETETYMSVDIALKNWTVHSYDVDL